MPSTLDLSRVPSVRETRGSLSLFLSLSSALRATWAARSAGAARECEEDQTEKRAHARLSVALPMLNHLIVRADTHLPAVISSIKFSSLVVRERAAARSDTRARARVHTCEG